jgi:ADP-ribose pyrophosphatase YjhB (NUDIX family)
MRTQFTIGSFGVIFNEKGQVLLCHRTDYDAWNIPGGGVESGESPVDAIRREVKEETGLDVGSMRLVGVYNKEGQNDIVFCFVCTIVGGAITLNDEADKIEYFDMDKIPKNISPRHVERIRDAMKEYKEPIFKTQLGKSTADMIKEGLLK